MRRTLGTGITALSLFAGRLIAMIAEESAQAANSWLPSGMIARSVGPPGRARGALRRQVETSTTEMVRAWKLATYATPLVGESTSGPGARRTLIDVPGLDVTVLMAVSV